MGHTFDTGLAKPQRSLVREAVAGRLADLLKAAEPPRYLAAIKYLPKPMRGQSDEDGKAMLIEVLQGQAPAIAIAIGRKQYDRTGPNTLEQVGELELVVYVTSAHGRDIVEGRLSQDVSAERTLTADPGIETILEHVEERLLGQELGIETVSALAGGEEDEVATFKDMTIWSQSYTVTVDRTVNPARGITQLVTSAENRVGLDGVSGDLDAPENAFVTTVSTIDPED